MFKKFLGSEKLNLRFKFKVQIRLKALKVKNLLKAAMFINFLFNSQEKFYYFRLLSLNLLQASSLIVRGINESLLETCF